MVSDKIANFASERTSGFKSRLTRRQRRLNACMPCAYDSNVHVAIP